MSVRRLLEAPIGEITFEDIEQLISEEAEEDQRFDLKRDLPAEKGQSDPWMLPNAKKIGNRAKKELATEIVAFANAHGGVVVVGVDETDTHPKRAVGLAPVLIPRVHECADRLHESLQSIIDPPLAGLEVRGITSAAGDGSGVLILRTPASIRAPHGHGQPPEVYMRRGARSEPMTMRDIQALLFETRTRGERVQAVLDDHSRKFGSFSKASSLQANPRRDRYFDGTEKLVHFRCSVVPVEALSVDAFELLRSKILHLPDLGQYAFTNELGPSWRPELGGVTSSQYAYHWGFTRWHVQNSGAIYAESFLIEQRYKNVEGTFFPGSFAILSGHVLAVADLLRRTAGLPSTELAVECEFYSSGEAVPVYGDGRWSGEPLEPCPAHFRTMPVSVGRSGDLTAIFLAVEREIWHALGLPSYTREELPPDRLIIAAAPAG